MARKIFYSLIFLLIALCSSAFAEADLYAVHETLVDVSYKYRQPPQNFDTFDYDDWISYDQTARFFCLTLEVTDPEKDFAWNQDNPNENPFDFDNPPTFTITGNGYSYFDSYRLVKASADTAFKLAPANLVFMGGDNERSQRFGTSTVGYVPVNDMGEQIHCLVEADDGLNNTSVTWTKLHANTESEEEGKTATIPTFKTTAQQLNDFVPYIEYVREASDDFITQVRNTVDAVLAGNDAENTNQTFLNNNRNNGELGKIGAIKGFKWRFVKTNDTDTAISLDKDIKVQIVAVYSSSFNTTDKVYSGEVINITAGTTIQGEVTFETGDNIPTIGNPPMCAIIRYYFDDSEKEIYQWRFVGHNVDDDPEKIDAVPSLTYGVNATVLESWYPLGGRGHTQELFNNSVISSIAEAHNKSSAQIILRWHLQAGNIAIPGSSNEQHIFEDYDIWDFSLSDNEMTQIAELEKDTRFSTY